MGITTHKTMKLVGKIGEEEVIEMIDPGATNNFISAHMDKNWEYPVKIAKDTGLS